MNDLNSDLPTLAVPKWAEIFSWCAPIALCAAVVWFRDSAWTRGTVPSLVLTYCFGLIWIRMAVRFGRGESVPGFRSAAKPPSASWMDSPAGSLLQATIILAASALLALLW